MALLKPQEASSSTSPCSYDVFLSFRGEDTRKGFTDHLYTALDHAGFRTFRDDDAIERGEKIKSELQKGIQESRISIIVFSKNYASSTRCLDELVMIQKRKTTYGQLLVLPLFYDVDPSEVKKQIGSFEEAFTRHEEEIEKATGERKEELKSKVAEWRAALREVAHLAGMNLHNQDDGHEARFIQKVIKVVEDKLSCKILDIAPFPIGINSRADAIQHWLEDRSINVGIVAICGMGGIGKTTIAKFLYNLNYSRFEGSSFLENVREISNCQDGLVRLQRQLLSDILVGREVKINSVAEGIIKIKDAIRCKRVLIVLDDVDKQDQLYAVLGMRDWIFPGSKIIITTRRERLLRSHEAGKVHRVENLDYNESLELFSWHAFGQSYAIDGFMDVSERVVRYCGGLPLAIKVLGSSLSGRKLNVWESELEKLKAIPDHEIVEKLKISYDSLQDEHDKKLFLHLACFFVGRHQDYTVTILDICEFFSVVGIENLIDRCLLTIDKNKRLVMHQLLQELGRGIACQEPLNEPGERSILCNHKDSFNVLRENTGTSKIEGLILNMDLLKEDKSATTVFGVNRKRRFEEFLDNPVLSNVGNSLKRYCFGIFSNQLVGTAKGNSDHVTFEADAFAGMHKLKLLQLNHVHINGPYENFPKGLRWLSWHGFPCKSIPSEFPLESLVALDMCYSSLINVWQGTRLLKLLKILNLSHSHCLAKTPNFSKLPNLERLILNNCTRLAEIHESVGHLKRLVLLILRDCKNLRKLPGSICMLKNLETLDISGCSSLEEFPMEIENMESLTVLSADGTTINRPLSTTGEVKAWHSFIQPWLLSRRSCPEDSWVSFPRSLVRLCLKGCNLSDSAFPTDLSNLSSLQFLCLTGNPICSLPDFIRGLPGLQILHLNSCERLQSLIGLPELAQLSITNNTLLEKVIFRSVPKKVFVGGEYNNLVEVTGYFKLEPIGNVDSEIISDLGLSDLESLANASVKLCSIYAEKLKRLPLQGCHERHIFFTYIPGSKAPSCYDIKNTGSSITFALPLSLNARVRRLSVCSVYALNHDFRCRPCLPHTIISNATKALIWSHGPEIFGIPEDNEDMMWLSYWKFEENQLEGGDKLNVLVVGGEALQVKVVGVHLVYDEEEEEHDKKITQQIPSTTCEEKRGGEVSQQINLYGNVVPGNVSGNLSGTKVYSLGFHYEDCKYCPPLTIATYPRARRNRLHRSLIELYSGKRKPGTFGLEHRFQDCR